MLQGWGREERREGNCAHWALMILQRLWKNCFCTQHYIQPPWQPCRWQFCSIPILQMSKPRLWDFHCCAEGQELISLMTCNSNSLLLNWDCAPSALQLDALCLLEAKLIRHLLSVKFTDNEKNFKSRDFLTGQIPSLQNMEGASEIVSYLPPTLWMRRMRPNPKSVRSLLKATYFKGSPFWDPFTDCPRKAWGCIFIVALILHANFIKCLSLLKTNNFRFPEKLPRWYREFPYALCPASPDVDIFHNRGRFVNAEKLTVLYTIN